MADFDMQEVDKKVQEQYKKGIPHNITLEKLGVESADYYKWASKNRAAKNTARGEEELVLPAQGSGKGRRYTWYTFQPVRKKVYGLIKKGHSKAAALKMCGIAWATFKKWENAPGQKRQKSGNRSRKAAVYRLWCPKSFWPCTSRLPLTATRSV